MAFSLTDQQHPDGDDVYYRPGFRTVIETHLPFLRTSPDVQRLVISPEKIYQHEGDFYGLLMTMGISLQFHWIYLRVNGMESSHQFGKQLRDPYRERYQFTLIIPSTKVIADLKSLYLTTQG